MCCARNMRTVSSASARICAAPSRQNMARTKAAHASAAPSCQRSMASAQRWAWMGLPKQRGDDRGQHRRPRASFDPAVVLQPLKPPLGVARRSW